MICGLVLAQRTMRTPKKSRKKGRSSPRLVRGITPGELGSSTQPTPVGTRWNSPYLGEGLHQLP